MKERKKILGMLVLKYCRDFDVEVIDTHAIAGSIDGIHMDESGHKQVADVLISVIQEL